MSELDEEDIPSLPLGQPSPDDLEVPARHGDGRQPSPMPAVNLDSSRLSQPVAGLPPLTGMPPPPPTGMPPMGVWDPGYQQFMYQQYQSMISGSKPVAPVLKPKAKKKKTGGFAARFSLEEKNMLLDLIENVLPMGQECWLRVLSDYNKQVDMERQRDKTGIQRCFNTMVASKKPTGDPTMPEEVRRAKHLNYRIQEKSQMQAFGTDKEGEFRTDSPLVDDDDDVGNEDGKEEQAPTENNASASTKTPSSNKRKEQTPVTGRKFPKGKLKKDDEGDDMLRAFLESEKLHAKMREKREKRRDKNNHKQFMMMMAAMTQAATGLATALISNKQPSSTNTTNNNMTTNNTTTNNREINLTVDSSDSSDSDSDKSNSSTTLSSVDSSKDSGPVIVAKTSQKMKRTKARNNKKKRKLN